MRTRCGLRIMVCAVVSLLSFCSQAASAGEEAALSSVATLATVSGTIRHNGMPVAGVQVDVWWETGGDGRTTGADGRYSVAGVPLGGWVAIAVLPPAHLRLAFRSWGTQPVSGDVVKDFDLQSGHLLSGELRTPEGQRHDAWLGLSTIAHLTALPEGEWLGARVEEGRFQVILPPDIYTLDALIPPFYMPRTAVDLRNADRTGLVITLLNEPEPPFFTDPPRADRITVGPPDTEGYATVTGGPGAVLPFSGVAIVNLSALNLTVTHSDAAGGFSARLFAPPGSSLWIKYDPDATRTNQMWADAQVIGKEPSDLYDAGAIITVGTPGTASEREQHFTSAGAFRGEGHDWAGWWLRGTLGTAFPLSGVSVPNGGTGPGLEVRRGDPVRLVATVRMSSPALECSGTPPYTPRLDVELRHLFDGGGWAEEGPIWFNTDLFTPTGLPIEREAPAQSRGLVSYTLPALTCVSSHAVEGIADVTFTIPQDLPDGTYGVFARVDQGGMPLASDVPLTVVWYHDDTAVATLPLLKVESTAAARIPWVLLADYPLNGHRGVVAREDSGHYALPTRSIYPPQHVVVPRLDERSGEPMAYRLEPASNWLSSTDRRLPCPPTIPLALPSGELTVRVLRPDGVVDTLGPAPIRQSSVRTPTTPGGAPLNDGTGHIGDLYHLTTLDDRFAYAFTQDGPHVITLDGHVRDMFGNTYAIAGTYDVDVARILDLDPAQLPTTPYKQGDAFAPGLHVYPPVPAEVTIKLVQMPDSDPARAITDTITGQANRFGYFQPALGTDIRLVAAGEFRVDYTAVYTATDGRRWAGSQTWGNVIEGTSPQIEAHGRRGMDYHHDRIDDMPAWFEVFQLQAEKVGIEVYYPYFSGDVHWGIEDGAPGDSIHTIISVKDLTGSQTIYNAIRASWPRARTTFRWPPDDTSPEGLEKRLAVGEAPLVITTSSGKDPSVVPEEIDQWGYWYGSSERPDVHVRELISEDNMGTAYWRFNDTYGYQIGEPADGDHPGDIKWEFGGAVLRVPSRGICEYGIYSSLWVLLPHGDAVGARVTPPFQDATGASINGGPILTLQGQDIDMLFLPKGVRPGDVLEVGDVIAFSGHVGPPLDSRVAVTITSPSGAVHARTWHANKIGWLYDPTFDFVAEHAGRWTVDVSVVHDRPYVGNGVTPQSHNRGTMLGTNGRYEFYVVARDAPRLSILNPPSGVLPWPAGVEGMTQRIQPVEIQGIAPPGTTAVRYTIHDKGVVMGQGSVVPDASGAFAITYDAIALHEEFSMLSLTAHEGLWEGLADEVAINLLAIGAEVPQGNTVTLIGEEVFVGSDARPWIYLPLILKRLA